MAVHKFMTMKIMAFGMSFMHVKHHLYSEIKPSCNMNHGNNIRFHKVMAVIMATDMNLCWRKSWQLDIHRNN